MWALPASGQLYHYFPNALIPDPSVAGLTDTRVVTSEATAILDLNVHVMISGDPAANGDYYATLTHGSGFAVLLNRVGRRDGTGNSRGYPDNGFDVVLDDEAPNGDIHIYRLTAFGSHTVPVDPLFQSVLTGSWVPDGRSAPFSSVTDLSPRAASPLSAFDGLDPNGSWTLFIADVSSGGSGTLVSWSLEVTPVPEPAEYITASALFVLGSTVIVRRLRK